jgi:hypothetical protein
MKRSHVFTDLLSLNEKSEEIDEIPCAHHENGECKILIKRSRVEPPCYGKRNLVHSDSHFRKAYHTKKMALFFDQTLKDQDCNMNNVDIDMSVLTIGMTLSAGFRIQPVARELVSLLPCNTQIICSNVHTKESWMCVG